MKHLKEGNDITVSRNMQVVTVGPFLLQSSEGLKSLKLSDKRVQRPHMCKQELEQLHSSVIISVWLRQDHLNESRCDDSLFCEAGSHLTSKVFTIRGDKCRSRVAPFCRFALR